jgi:hypothetical protein
MFTVADRLGMTVGRLRREMTGHELMLWAEYLKPKDANG